MLPFGIGFSEILVIFLVLVIFVGPEGIPQAVRSIAKVVKAIRSFVDEVRYSEEFDEVKREILDPLDEARRFNPQERTRAWVKQELEEPIKSVLKEEPVHDFDASSHPNHYVSTPYIADDQKSSNPQLEHSSSALDVSTTGADNHEDSTTHIVEVSKKPSVDNHEGYTHSNCENLDHPDDTFMTDHYEDHYEDDDDDDDEGPVSAANPLERNLVLPTDSN